MNPAAHVMLCVGVLYFACQWMEWTKPPVVHRIVEAAKPVVKQRMVHVIEISPDEPPKNYVLMEPGE